MENMSGRTFQAARYKGHLECSVARVTRERSMRRTELGAGEAAHKGSGVEFGFHPTGPRSKGAPCI